MSEFLFNFIGFTLLGAVAVVFALAFTYLVENKAPKQEKIVKTPEPSNLAKHSKLSKQSK